ncbi:hypothetical protein ARSEF4850_005076 [Beauveria asiatica]
MSAEKASPKSAHSTERLPEPEPETKSLQDALDDDDNALVSMRYRGLEDTYRRHIESNKKDIEKMIYTLLGVRWCRIMTPQLWKSGSFNLAIPVFLPQERTVYLRLPLYYRLGEDQCPGNVEEKLRTEIATYQWVSENCADVPIPTLHAFGLADGSTYTHPQDTPLIERFKIVHEAALFGADKDIVVPLMVRMPSCAKGVTFKEWCETGYPEFTVANQL